MATNRTPVAQGGMWNTPKANYSKETQALLKEMMRESKLTNFQQREINKTLAGGGTLPTDVNPTSSARPRPPASSKARPQSKILNPRNTSAQIRTKETIENSGAYEREKFVAGPPSLYEKNKNQFVNKLIYGEDTPPTDWKKLLDRIEPEPAPAKDRFDELQAEITERRQFLDEMYALGQGKKYETIINTEISQLIREMELVDKKRTKILEQQIAADKQKRQNAAAIPKPDVSDL